MVKYALLGLLREHPDHGYQLRKRFEQQMGRAWRLNNGQVYQTLQALTKGGLVVEIDVADAGDDRRALRPRRVFMLTPKGQKTLERWLQRQPARPRPARDETLIRLLILTPERHAEAIAQIERQLHVYRQHSTRLLAEHRRRPTTTDHGGLVRTLGLEASLLHTEAHIKWLECGLRLLQEQCSTS